MPSTPPIAILYEHPEWFQPLFAALDRRGLPYEPLLAHAHRFDPSAPTVPYSLVVNRVSPSSYLRGHADAILYAQHYLAYLETIGAPVVNGARAYALEVSKARQLALLARLGLPHPRTRVVNHVSQVLPAAEALAYPLILKPNVGGSGALMRRFERPEALRQALQDGEVEALFGPDHTLLVQEYHPPRGGSIVRVEALGGRFLYAIRIQSDPDQGFNLCPADICRTPDTAAVEAARAAASTSAPAPDAFAFCATDTPVRKALRIEAANPPPWVVEGVLRVFEAGGIDVGGVEYLESERDGRLYLYDVNALSNFVTDAPRLVGFDPFERLVDYLAARAGLPVRATTQTVSLAAVAA